MIPKTFHSFPDVETKRAVCTIRDDEMWNTRRNALFQVLGLYPYGKERREKER